MATEIWVNIGSGNGLLPDGTKPLPEPMLTFHNWSPVTFISGKEMPQPSINKICLNIIYLKFYWNSPGANELKLPKHGLNPLLTCCSSVLERVSTLTLVHIRSSTDPAALGALYHEPAWLSNLQTEIINALNPRHLGWNFAENIFKCNFVNKNVPILLGISSFILVMAWRHTVHWWTYASVSLNKNNEHLKPFKCKSFVGGSNLPQRIVRIVMRIFDVPFFLSWIQKA